MSRRVKFVSWLSSLVMVCLCPVFLHGQNSASSSVTGCLKKGSEKGGFYLAAQDGKVYELISKSVDLSQHVNHIVTVSGHEVKLPESHESAVAEHEKAEAGGKTYTDLQVTSLKMVSESCTQ